MTNKNQHSTVNKSSEFVSFVCAGPVVDPRKVLIIAGHHNWIVAAYAHFVICYR